MEMQRQIYTKALAKRSAVTPLPVDPEVVVLKRLHSVNYQIVPLFWGMKMAPQV